MSQRSPLVLSNWKMAMTIAESLAFVRDFQGLAAGSRTAQPKEVDPRIVHLFTIEQLTTHKKYGKIVLYN